MACRRHVSIFNFPGVVRVFAQKRRRHIFTFNHNESTYKLFATKVKFKIQFPN